MVHVCRAGLWWYRIVELIDAFLGILCLLCFANLEDFQEQSTIGVQHVRLTALGCQVTLMEMEPVPLLG